MSFPKKCRFCGATRMNAGDRPCVRKDKTKMSVKEKIDIEENCPAVVMMYA